MTDFLNTILFEITITIGYFFCLIIFLSFVMLIIKGDDKNRTLQKIIGGLGVFIVAIIAKNNYVYLLSLFIGGLIIASEDFMKFLAAVLKTRGDKVAETVQSFKTSEASAEDIEEKIEEESAEVAPIEESGIQNRTASETKEKTKYTIAQRAEKVKKIEELVNNKFRQIYGRDYLTQVKITNEYGSIVVDGIVKLNNVFSKIVEIKYISAKSFPVLRHIIGRFVKRLKRFGISTPTVVVVSEEMTVQSAADIYKEVKIVGKHDVDICFYKLDDNNLTSIEPKVPLEENSIRTRTIEYEEQ
jgi:hypothetical protein